LKSSQQFETPPQPEEQLSRFIYRHWNIRPDGTIKPDEFLPDPHDETSVFRTDDMSPAEITETGKEVGSRSNRLLEGWGDFLAEAAYERKLSVDPAPDVELSRGERHAVLVGWPPKEPKSLRMSIAVHLADKAGQVRRPAPPP